MYEQLKQLREFGTRSLLVHSLMAVTFVAAIGLEARPLSQWLRGDWRKRAWMRFSWRRAR